MLGIGKVPEVLSTREIEQVLLEGLGCQNPGEESWIITPYSTMDKLGTIRRAINEACKSDAQVKFVVRDEPEQVKSAKKGLSEARELGLELFAYHRLHAKLYWFENQFAVVTSANLVDGSFEASTELGLFVPCGGLHEDLRNWIKIEIEPQLRPADVSKKELTTAQKNKSQGHHQSSAVVAGEGHCIRCGKGIPKDLGKPYCLSHFKSWAKYSNPEYGEKHCHICGSTAKTSMDKPRCYACFKKKAS